MDSEKMRKMGYYQNTGPPKLSRKRTLLVKWLLMDSELDRDTEYKQKSDKIRYLPE